MNLCVEDKITAQYMKNSRYDGGADAAEICRESKGEDREFEAV